MNLEAISRAYVTCVELEERSRDESAALSDDLATLRSDLHALLMTALRQARLPFSDRSDAARIAFDIVQGRQRIP